MTTHGWEAFRENKDESYERFTLEEFNMPHFWVKIRKMSSYTLNNVSFLKSMGSTGGLQFPWLLMTGRSEYLW